MRACVHVCVCVHVYVHMCACVCVCVYMCMCLRRFLCAFSIAMCLVIGMHAHAD